MPEMLTNLSMDKRLRRELKALAKFIEVYCHDKHIDEDKTLVELKGFDIESIIGRRLSLCPACTKLLTHGFVKRANCPMDPKPPCKHCLDHCYAPQYRAQIREVMKYSGRKLVLRGRLDYLYHLFF